MTKIYEIRDENERLRTQLRELTSSDSSSKIVPIRSSQTSSMNLEDTNSAAIVKDKIATFDAKSSDTNDE